MLWIAFIPFLLILTQRSNGGIAPPRYRINLDAEPEVRWTEVINDNMELIPLIAQQSKQIIPERIQGIVFKIAEQLLRYFPSDYSREIQGIANLTGLPVGEIVGINILYDITDFDRETSFYSKKKIPKLGCTSIVAADINGTILHGRNLDYEMTSLLRKTTIIADFVRNDKIVFTSPTFVSSVGILTGQKPGMFSVSLNARYSGGILDNILMELWTRFKHPVTFEIRKVLEQVNSFEKAIEYLSTQHFIAPEYLIVGGVRANEGAIITRNRMTAVDINRLSIEENKWYLVETNDDQWKKASDPRRKYSIKYLNEVTQNHITPATMLQILNRSPINNEETVFSTVMSAAMPEIIYLYTKLQSNNSINSNL